MIEEINIYNYTSEQAKQFIDATHRYENYIENFNDYLRKYRVS